MIRTEGRIRPGMSAFEIFLRTGLKFDGVAPEAKFNGWHSEETGEFTEVGNGRFHGSG